MPQPSQADEFRFEVRFAGDDGAGNLYSDADGCFAMLGPTFTEAALSEQMASGRRQVIFDGEMKVYVDPQTLQVQKVIPKTY